MSLSELAGYERDLSQPLSALKARTKRVYKYVGGQVVEVTSHEPTAHEPGISPEMTTEESATLYLATCPACGEHLRARLFVGRICIPPPTIIGIHQCTSVGIPPVEFTMRYSGPEPTLDDEDAT
jgi:hypothetical protein